MSVDKVEIGDVGGRIQEAGRREGKNFVVVDCGKGQEITIHGLSDTITKEFAVNIFKYVRIEFDVQHDG